MGEDWPAASWPGAPGRALTTTRAGGVSRGSYASLNLGAHVGDVNEAVARNRELLGSAIGVDRIQWLDQVHGTRCLAASLDTAFDTSLDEPKAVPEADAAWTADRGLGLAVLTADCLPVALCHRDGSAIAIAHAGWRGLVAGVLPATLRSLPGDPSEYRAWIGPGIGVDAYQVGAEVVAVVSAMSDIGGRADDFFFCSPGVSPGEGGRYQLDLAGLAAAQLAYLGVAEVLCERICSFSDQRFYSYRRDGVTGRMASVVWLD
jgi:hypothetical protein